MSNTPLIYATDSIRIGRYDWRIEVRWIDGSRCSIPVFRRVGNTGPWRWPTDFPGTMPAGLINFVLQNAVPIGRALS